MLITFTTWTRQFPVAMAYTVDTRTGEIVDMQVDHEETAHARDTGELHQPWFWEQFPASIHDCDIVVQDGDDIEYIVGFDIV